MRWWQAAILLTASILPLVVLSFVISTRKQRRSSSTHPWSEVDIHRLLIPVFMGDPQQPRQEFPYIFAIRTDTIYVQASPFERVAFILDCRCDNCLSVQASLNLPQLMERWEAEATYREREQQRRRIERAKAEERAKALLIRLLPEECVNTLALYNYFEFESQHGRRYRISVGYSGNVISGGRSYCCYLQGSGLPTYDHMIGQYLALKYNEDLFLATAY